MTDNLENLILDLLEWMGDGPRPYAEVIEAWRTSCPRFPVWEDANSRGFVDRNRGAGGEQTVSVSIAGTEYLRMCRGDAALT